MTTSPSPAPDAAPSAATPKRRSKFGRNGLFVMAGLGIVLAIVVALQPSTYHVSRSVLIDAPAQRVFNKVQDFRAWKEWSPWYALDPKAVHGYEGPSSGVGAVYTWAGNDKVGEGRMTLTQAHPFETIDIELSFKRPMEGTADVRFIFEPAEDKTRVTWEMSGHNGFVGKLFCLFVSMDKMIGGDFERGLKSLGSAIASSTTQPATTLPAP